MTLEQLGQFFNLACLLEVLSVEMLSVSEAAAAAAPHSGNIGPAPRAKLNIKSHLQPLYVVTGFQQASICQCCSASICVYGPGSMLHVLQVHGIGSCTDLPKPKYTLITNFLALTHTWLCSISL